MYEIVESTSEWGLQNEVNSYLEMGYKCVGGLVIKDIDREQIIYMQAMVMDRPGMVE